jgi:hypothetical protein
VTVFIFPKELPMQNFLIPMVELLFICYTKCDISEYRSATEDEFTNNREHHLVGFTAM